MSDLSFLSVLDLSNNNLFGRIPLSTQLQSFGATSYSENPRLCGAPLRKCPGDEPAKLPNNNGIENMRESDEELLEPLWFFSGMIVGFFIRFGGVFGSLLINRSWRQILSIDEHRRLDHMTVALKMAICNVDFD
ncbi:hypothetical protein ES319_A07G097200v1 [Gossypium barbadense]|uniref:Leucine-rich repeat-containing N-terminal plant-type domain-containing protein n=2 Tax=Gossypium TaxID=3633 RepID=A0A5J5V1W8_GOSBA|nr:hypothetical protein ES319_A07G097200v1 [Gossypium barbadense]TYH09538.1 hypothetical protein ES288_A07G103900v1 [Gossypium darwinii]TYH09539.1 hypothetical protein ES288_A07G103900v1 [Gossypium darwinii]